MFSLFSIIVAYGLSTQIVIITVQQIVNVSTILPFIYILPRSGWFARRHSLNSVRYVLCQSFNGDDRKHIDTIARDNQKKSTQQISAGRPSSLCARGAGEDTYKDVRFFKNLSYKLMFEFCPFYVVFVQ